MEKPSVDVGLGAIAALRHRPTRARDNGLFERLQPLLMIRMRQSARPISLIRLKQVMANFSHVDTGPNLDQRV